GAIIGYRMPKKITRFFFFLSIRRKISFKRYDLIYVRFAPASLYFTKFMEEIKTLNPSVKIVVEMPTFPFVNELSGIKKIIHRLLSPSYHQWNNWVDGVTYPNQRDDVYGV